VDNDRFADADGSAQRTADAWRWSLGIAPSAQVLLFAAKLDSGKAPDRLLDAFLRRGHNDEHLVIAGVGELERRLREMAGGRSNVHFIGFQNQSVMPAVYRLGDVFVLPSLGETWGLAVNEAMASQRPVIVSDRVGCASDLVAQRGTGIVYSAADGDGLHRAMARMLDDPAARVRMGVAARQLIESWSLRVQAERIEQAVSVATGRVAPDGPEQRSMLDA
jgi:glycosyltransferase involved in cell wall biosynthesis